MRDAERIGRILDKLKAVWMHNGNADMRLGQLMINFCGHEDSNRNWNMEDDLLEKFLDHYIKNAMEEKKDDY